MNVGLKLFQALESLVARCSLVGDGPFFDPGEFAWIRLLEHDWRAIRGELDDVLRLRDELPNFQDLSPAQSFLTGDDRWKTYFFYAYGRKAAGNCERCPRTTRALQAVPGLTTAFFSLLGPHKHLPEHRGPYNGVLRCHLGLLVPEPANACAIRVGGQTAHWHEGKCLLFDDTFRHTAWNDTDHDRVVLFIDVMRPLPRPVSWLNAAVVKAIGWSPFVRGSEARYLEWERRFEQRWAALSVSEGEYPAPPGAA